MPSNYSYDQGGMSSTMSSPYRDPQRNQTAPTQPSSRNMQTPPMSGSSMGSQGTVPGTDMPITPLASSMPSMPTGVETPTTVQSPYYTAGFLKKFIGKNVRVEFVLGTSGILSDRTGTLLEVGASYIVIQPLLTDDLLMCDLYSIRFVTIFR
jgi:hypothetical protein